MSVYIDGRYYYSPCEKCKDKECYSCTLTKYKEELKLETDKRMSADFRIRTELEPRIKAERDSYDRWVSTDTGAEVCDCFSSLLDELIEFVTENEKYMEWEDANGDLEQKILYLIKNRVDDDLYCIADMRTSAE